MGGSPVTAALELPPRQARGQRGAGVVLRLPGPVPRVGAAVPCAGVPGLRLDFTAPPPSGDGPARGPDTVPSVDAVVEAAAWLLAIADRCPVHRTLESEVDVRTELEE